MTKLCKICGKPFTPTGYHQKYCSKECRNIRNAKVRRREKKVYKKICPICGKEFGATNNNIKYCSDECRKINISRINHRNYMKNHEYYLEKHREYQNKNKEKCKALHDKWRKENPDKVHAQNSRTYHRYKEDRKRRVYEWRKNNPEKAKLSKLRWEQKNPDKVKLYEEKSKAHKYRKRHNITEEYCIKHNDCVHCPYPYEVCLFE